MSGYEIIELNKTYGPSVDLGLQIKDAIESLGGKGGLVDARKVGHGAWTGLRPLSPFTVPRNVMVKTGIGEYEVGGTIVVQEGGRFLGMNNAHPGTTLRAADGLNADILHAQHKDGETDFWHWGEISNFRIDGNKENNEFGNGLQAWQPGENCLLDRLQIVNCPEDGIVMHKHAATGAHFRSLALFGNRYGLNLNDIRHVVTVDGLSGDDNESLLRVNAQVSLSLTVIGMKAEVHAEGMHEPVILIDGAGTMGQTTAQFIGGLASGRSQGSNGPVIEIRDTEVNLGLSNIVVFNYDDMIQDYFKDKTIPNYKAARMPFYSYVTSAYHG